MVRKGCCTLAHQSLNLKFDICVSYKRWNIYSVGGDVPVDSEMPMVTSSISRFNPHAQSFGGAHRGKMCVLCLRRLNQPDKTDAEYE
jgi:hypothetical protein